MSSSLLHSVKTQKTINYLAAQWRLAKKKVVIGNDTMFCNIAADEKNMHEVDLTKIPDDLIKRFEVWDEWKDITAEATVRLAKDLALLEQNTMKMMAKMIDTLQVMAEGSVGAVQRVQRCHEQALVALDAMKKTQEGHAQALDALESMKKIQAEHTAHSHTVERRFRHILLRIDSFG